MCGSDATLPVRAAAGTGGRFPQGPPPRKGSPRRCAARTPRPVSHRRGTSDAPRWGERRIRLARSTRSTATRPHASPGAGLARGAASACRAGPPLATTAALPPDMVDGSLIRARLRRSPRRRTGSPATASAARGVGSEAEGTRVERIGPLLTNPSYHCPRHRRSAAGPHHEDARGHAEPSRRGPWGLRAAGVSARPASGGRHETGGAADERTGSERGTGRIGGAHAARR